MTWTLAEHPSRRVRVGVVGCGDVAHRRYLPGLAIASDGAEVTACCDADADRAAVAAAAVESWSPRARAWTSLPDALGSGDVDAVVNLTPAPAHGQVTRTALEAGVHVFSEKPIAASVEEASELIGLARASDLLLLCAPATALTRRSRWLSEIVASERFGPLTLAVAHYADLGPAAWREYTGDPRPFYREGVGPVFDHGVYRLHELTMLAGPVRRVQAMGAIGRPRRVVRAGPMAGQAFEVTTPDHVLINLEFASGALGQLLSSFATAATRAPWLELHFERATVSFDLDSQYDREAGASLYVDDDGPQGLEGWVHGLRPPPPGDDVDIVESGALHFVRVLRGEEAPVLTAEHARHVLEIILAAYASIADGQSHAVETTF